MIFFILTHSSVGDMDHQVLASLPKEILMSGVKPKAEVYMITVQARPSTAKVSYNGPVEKITKNKNKENVIFLAWLMTSHSCSGQFAKPKTLCSDRGDDSTSRNNWRQEF